MIKYDYNEDQIRKAVAISTTYSEVMEHIGVPVKGGNGATMKRVIEKFGIDVSHFTGRRAGQCSSQYVPSDVYINGGKRIQSAKLLEKLVKEGKKELKCENCGISEWNNKPIIFHLHHIDGNHDNNSLDNLQVLCPNCHSQTYNFAGLANQNPKVKYYCKYCGVEVKTKACRCTLCGHKYKSESKYTPISKEQLIEDIRAFKGNMCAIGRKYGISDNAIRKKCRKYNINLKDRKNI